MLRPQHGDRAENIKRDYRGKDENLTNKSLERKGQDNIQRENIANFLELMKISRIEAGERNISPHVKVLQ